MKATLTLLLFLFAKPLFAQDANDRIVYLDAQWKKGTKDNYTHLRIIKEYFLKKDQYRFEDYYKSGKLQMEGNSTDKDYLVRDGLFKYYYENGNKRTETTYEEGKPIGMQTDWYENGTKKMESDYFMAAGEKVPEQKINQFWNVEGKQLVTDGNGYFEDSNEKGSEKGNLLNGLKHGIWEGKNTQYGFSYKETYAEGKFINGKSIDKNNEEHSYNTILLESRPNKGLPHFYKYISQKFSIPRSAEGISGTMLFTFIIGKDGDARDFEVIKSLGPDLDNEGIRVIKKYPDWASGELRGVKVPLLFSIPIRITKSTY